MPRITKATRTSLPVKSNNYNLNSDFRDYATGKLYANNSDSLVFWSNYCDPEIVTDVPGYNIVGSNLSTTSGVSNHKIYSKVGVGLQSARIEDEESFCGSKCIFYASANRSSASGTGYNYTSSDYFLLSDHDDLSFTNGSNDVDFTISFWIKPLEAGGFNINDGGVDSAGKVLPTFLNKKNEYNLAIDTNGRLRLTLFNSASIFIYGESKVNAFNSGVWNNIVVRYKSSLLQNGITFFNNGVEITDATRSNITGLYSAMINSSNPFTFGVGDLKQSNMPSAHISGIGPTVNFSELAIWKKCLSTEAIQAVYNSSLTCAALVNVRSSGYTSLNPRIRIRQLDNMTGSYPSVSRVGDRDFTGRHKTKFDDLKVINFGDQIVDDFDILKQKEIASKNINKSNWTFSGGMEVRRESLTNYNGNTFENGVLVFKGPGIRYLKTKRRVRNAIIEFDLIQGPHNMATNILGEGLQLEKGNLTENLKVQFNVTEDNVSWQDIDTYNPSALTSFYSIDLNSSHGVNYNPTTQETLNKYSKKIRIYFSDIPAGDSDYYIRFVQTTSVRSNKAVWGIGRIKITSMNQDVRYPILLNHDSQHGKYIDSLAIATPHTRSDLTAKGRSVSGTTDHFLHFTPGENISPFSEHYAVENLDPTDLFHKIGSDPSTGVLGMSGRLADKTKIHITLGKSDTNFELGHTDRSSYDNPLDQQPLSGLLTLVASTGRPSYSFSNAFVGYYKNKNKELQSFKTPNYAYVATGFEDFVKEDVKLGIGTIDNVATRSIQLASEIPSVAQQFGKDVLSNFVRPIKTFGFPFSSKFELSQDSCISANDYIDKPFVIEKIVVDFKAAFEFAANNDLGEDAYSLYSSYKNSGGDPGDRIAVGPRVIIPTFFVLNQFKDKFKINTEIKRQQWNGSSVDSTIKSVSYESENGLSRELVSYGQMTLFASSSDNYGLDVEKLLSDGLGRDLNVNILEKTGQVGIDIKESSINHFTSSFRLEFPCRVAPKTNFNQKIIFLTGSATSANPADNLLNAYLSSDPTGGRNIRNIERGSRGLINNYSSRTPGKSYKTWGLYNSVIPYEVETTSQSQADQYSPYVLLPGDNLIFGWHYPPNVSYGFRTTGNSDQKRNIMRLLGKSEVYLYGSFLSNKQETHEYSNQPLTSNAIHEIIGAEKTLDDYQIATRGELSGSYIDRWVYFEEAWDHGLTYDVYTYSEAFAGRFKRIGKPSLSISNLDIEPLDYTKFYLGVIPPSARPGYSFASKLFQKELGEIKQIQRFVNLSNKLMFFNDSVAKKGSFFKDSTYGTLQTEYHLSTNSFTSEAADRKVYADGTIHKPAGSKYYFNYRHHGHYFDFYEQGKDSKMWRYSGVSSTVPEDAQEINKYDISKSNTPPVAVRFVKSELVEDSRIKVYKMSSYSELFGAVTDDELKPYNSNIYATSSIPYKDNERTFIFP
jgi:hypothetical protein